MKNLQDQQCSWTKVVIDWIPKDFKRTRGERCPVIRFFFKKSMNQKHNALVASREQDPSGNPGTPQGQLEVLLAPTRSSRRTTEVSDQEVSQATSATDHVDKGTRQTASSNGLNGNQPAIWQQPTATSYFVTVEISQICSSYPYNVKNFVCGLNEMSSRTLLLQHLINWTHHRWTVIGVLWEDHIWEIEAWPSHQSIP